ncbi:MAG: 23S rRNA (adenine(2503)-C(2))-methyltransferase RlmN [Nitrospira sp.]|nr:23S rRNA (adenine(2503)-C(2))-methyltransferase RlmN [Candidatus Brocadiales bacterium]MBL7049366.1 23S rRNA (adenine(2503)-C(2))-methyltransferase RlmN [Nitrospira sp.]
MKTNLKSLSNKALKDFIIASGQKSFRANQINEWIYTKYASSINEMSDLSLDFRDQLSKTAFISLPHLVTLRKSKDGTTKFLLEMQDGQRVESVLLPNSIGNHKYTLCISSQAGCAMGCIFCTTGAGGLKRNLQAHEIVDQFIMAKKHVANKSDRAAVTNIVFMGMGEPFANFTNLTEAISRITKLMHFSKKRITVSTCGIAPHIYDLMQSTPGINLAVSLNATTDSIRDLIMPINKKYPLKELLKACQNLKLQSQQHITFEYIMLKNINDSPKDAHRLVLLLKGIRAKVNLIPFNKSCLIDLSENYCNKTPSEKILIQPSSRNQMLLFQEVLLGAGIKTLIRKSRGSDIAAACGQLAAENTI